MHSVETVASHEWNDKKDMLNEPFHEALFTRNDFETK